MPFCKLLTWAAGIEVFLMLYRLGPLSLVQAYRTTLPPASDPLPDIVTLLLGYFNMICVPASATGNWFTGHPARDTSPRTAWSSASRGLGPASAITNAAAVQAYCVFTFAAGQELGRLFKRFALTSL